MLRRPQIGHRWLSTSVTNLPPKVPSQATLAAVNSDIYGYRVAKKFQMPDYTEEEQLNRSANANLFRLVYAYRSYGHLAADLDPLGIQKRPAVPELDPGRYGIPETNKTFNLTGKFYFLS
jgi:2-oxoglutarate dehydrogenase complex dehydrogenase (E1) component-like enzyme